MMQHFVIFVTILVCGEIFQQTPAADLEHFANDIDHRNIGALDSDEKGIRQLGKKDVIIFVKFATGLINYKLDSNYF